MSPGWQRTRLIAFRRTSSLCAPDTRFPRAVAGESYDRFAHAMWAQAQRWMRKHSHRFAGGDLTAHEAHDLLHAAAAVDLGRSLYSQEERLLTELIMAEWDSIVRFTSAIVPEIPSFLVGPR